MNTKVEQAGLSALDITLLVLAAALLVGGIAGFYYFGDLPKVARVLGLLATLVAAGAAVAFTGPGRTLRSFLQESNFELRKVVWPSRQETIRATGVIVLVVIVLSLLLGLIDLTLKWVIIDHLLKIGR
jgi:preprotein translocase subunit SecE